MQILKTNLILLILLISSISTSNSSLNLDLSNDLNVIEWSDVEPVTISSTLNSFKSYIVLDDNNILHMVWYDYTDMLSAGTDADIFYKQMNVTSGVWTDPILISSSSDQLSANPSLVIDSNNNLYVIWEDSSDILSSGTDRDIFIRSYNDSTEIWNDIELISTGSDAGSYVPKIAIDSDDNLHVVWYDYSDILSNGVDADIFYRFYDATSATWSSVSVISDISTANSNFPNLIIDTSDNVYILWIDGTDMLSSGTDTDIFFKKYTDATTTWSDTQLITAQSTTNAYSINIDIDPNDKLYMVYYDNTDILGAGTDADVFYQIYDPTLNVWSSPILISDTSDNSSYSIVIVIDTVGNIHFTWQDHADIDSSGTDSDIFYKVYDTNINQWSDLTILSESDVNSYSPMLVINNMEIFVTWYSATDIYGQGPDLDIYMRRATITPFAAEISMTVNDNVEISWDKVNYADEYHIYRSNELIYNTTGLTPHEITTDNSFTEELPDTGVYFYAVVAVNSQKESEISNLVFLQIDDTKLDSNSIGSFDLTDIDALLENPLAISTAILAGLSLILLVLLIRKGKK